MISTEIPRGGASVTAIECHSDLIAFVTTHFVVETHTSYPRSLNKAFETTPFRAENKHFLRFLGRTLLIAAEYGWPEAGGQMEYALKKGVNDPLDPRYVLHLATKMATKTLKQMDQKRAMIEQLKQNGHQNLKKQLYLILGVSDTWKLDFPEYTLEKLSPRGRLNLENQPLLLPDIGRLKQIAAINFVESDLNIDKAHFTEIMLEPTRIAFPEIELDSVFFHPAETWLPIIDPSIRIKS